PQMQAHPVAALDQTGEFLLRHKFVVSLKLRNRLRRSDPAVKAAGQVGATALLTTELPGLPAGYHQSPRPAMEAGQFHWRLRRCTGLPNYAGCTCQGRIGSGHGLKLRRGKITLQ